MIYGHDWKYRRIGLVIFRRCRECRRFEYRRPGTRWIRRIRNVR